MRVILLDRIFENKEDMFSLLTEDTENYAFSDQQMQRIEENLLLRSVDKLPEISQKTIKEIEEPDTFVRTDRKCKTRQLSGRKKLQKRLKNKFPETYKWWLRNYNGGEVYGEEIYSIYGIDFDSVIGGDIVYINELSRKNDKEFLNKIVISEPNDSIFYFDIS